MLRSAVLSITGRLSLESGYLPSVTQVRHKRVRLRKPAWMPRAPSKLFTLFKHPYVSKEEKQQYWDLYQRHELEIRSIQAYFAAEQKRIADEESEFSQVSIHEEEEFQALLRANDEENKLVGAERERRHREDFERRMEAERLRIEEVKAKQKEEEDSARRELQNEIANLHFITHETLDAAIKKAYNEPTSYDFAITLSGKKITGRGDSQQKEDVP